MQKLRKMILFRRLSAIILALLMTLSPSLDFLGGGVNVYAAEGEVQEQYDYNDTDDDADYDDEDLNNEDEYEDEEMICCDNEDCGGEDYNNEDEDLDGLGLIVAAGLNLLGFAAFNAGGADIFVEFSGYSVGDAFNAINKPGNWGGLGGTLASVIDDGGTNVVRVEMVNDEDFTGVAIPVDLGTQKLSDFGELSYSLKSDGGALNGKNITIFASASPNAYDPGGTSITSSSSVTLPAAAGAYTTFKTNITASGAVAELTGQIYIYIIYDWGKTSWRVKDLGFYALSACCNGACNPCNCSNCTETAPGQCCYVYNGNVNCIDLLASVANKTSAPNAGTKWTSWATILQLEVPQGTILQDYKAFNYDITTTVSGAAVTGTGSAPDRIQLEIFATTGTIIGSAIYAIDRESANIALPSVGAPNFVGANGRIKFASNASDVQQSNIESVKFNKAVLVAQDCAGDCNICTNIYGGGGGGLAPSDDIVIDFENLTVGNLAAPFRVSGGSTEADIHNDGGNKVLRFKPNSGNGSGVIIPVTIPDEQTLGDYEKITYRIKSDTAVYGKNIDFIGAVRGYTFETWLGSEDNIAKRLGRNSGSVITSWQDYNFDINSALSALSGEIDIMVGVQFLDDASQHGIYYYLDDIVLVKRNTINYTAAVNGTAGQVTSTELTLTFTDPVTNLLKSEITFTPGAGNPLLDIEDPVVVSGSNNKVWKVPLTDNVAAAENVSLEIDRLGIQSGSKTILVHFKLEQAMDDIVITFDAASASWNDRFKANGNGVSVEIDSSFGRGTPDGALKVTRLSANAMSGWNHWVRLGHIAQHATPGDTQLNLPAGAIYTITAHFFVPSEAAVGKTVSGPQMFLNNTNSGASIFPTDANAGTLTAGEWKKLEFKTNIMAVPLDSISFRLNASADATYPDYWFIDDVTVSMELAEIPEWDLTLDSLWETYEDDFLFGNIMNVDYQDSMDADTKAMYLHHYNAVTAENCMKPDSWGWNAANGTPNFNHAWTLINWAKAEGIDTIGHTLVWHQQSPKWLNEANSEPLTRSEAKANLETFISTVAGEFAGELLAWDVANEVFADGGIFNGDWRNNLRTSSMWYRAYNNGANNSIGESGADYVYDAFVFTRTADPNAILYYNDYNEDNVTKSSAIADMVMKLNWKWRTDIVNNPQAVVVAENYTGRPLIEGIGMQAHYNVNTSVAAVENSLVKFIEAGVKVSVTELDITSVTNPTADNLNHQANQYAQLFEVYKKYSNFIERVTIWGRDDGKSWRGDRHPLLFTAEFKAKPAYEAVINMGNTAVQKVPFFDWQAAQENPGEDPDLPDNQLGPKTANAIKGTPADVNDPLWNDAPEIVVDNRLYSPAHPGPQIGSTETSGLARVMWDENNLYVRVEVVDENIDFTSANDWEKDSVEVFFSELNFRGAYSATQGNQYRLTVPTAGSGAGSQGRVSAKTANTLLGVNWPTTAANAELDNDYAYSELTNTGYVVYMRIPFRGGFVGAEGDEVGFDIQINDPPPASGERTQVTWSDPLAGGYNSSLLWGEITLTVASQNNQNPPPNNNNNNNNNNNGNNGGGNNQPAPVQESAPAPSNNYGSAPQAQQNWNNAVNDVVNKINIAANTALVGGGPINGNVNHVINTGTDVVVPNNVLNTLQGTNAALMMNTGTGVTFSITGANIPTGTNISNLDLSINKDGLQAPAGKVSALLSGTITNRQIPMVNHDDFGMTINQHFNVGSQNAGNFANLYVFNEETGEFDYLGSYEINEKGQAMFGITGGGDYVMTVTENRPNTPIAAHNRRGSSYTVAPGDTLSRIARRNGLTLAQLRALNPGIGDQNRIRPGQTIRVR